MPVFSREKKQVERAGAFHLCSLFSDYLLTFAGYKWIGGLGVSEPQFPLYLRTRTVILCLESMMPHSVSY